MHRLNELAARLTPAQLKEVEDFAEFLVARGTASLTLGGPTSGKENVIRFDGWAGCLAGIEPDKSDKQFIRDAWNAVLDKYE